MLYHTIGSWNMTSCKNKSKNPKLSHHSPVQAGVCRAGTFVDASAMYFFHSLKLNIRAGIVESDTLIGGCLFTGLLHLFWYSLARHDFPMLWFLRCNPVCGASYSTASRIAVAVLPSGPWLGPGQHFNSCNFVGANSVEWNS